MEKAIFILTIINTIFLISIIIKLVFMDETIWRIDKKL